MSKYISQIQDESPSVNKLIYKYIKEDNSSPNYNINEILKKFPNLTELFFIANLNSYLEILNKKRLKYLNFLKHD